LSGILGDSEVRGRVIEAEGVRYVVLYREIAQYGAEPWTVGVHFRADTVNAPILRLVVAAAVGLAILLVSVVLALLLGRAIARPVRRLAEAADAVRDLQTAGLTPLPRSPLRELDSAALAFNSMITGLRWF